MKIGPKVRLAFLLVALLPLTTAGMAAYLIASRALTHKVFDQLESLASIERNRVENLVHQNLERLALVSSRTQLRLSLKAFLEQGKDEDRRRMTMILADALGSIPSFRTLSVLHTNGVVLASTDASVVGQAFPMPPGTAPDKAINCADQLILDDAGVLQLLLFGPLVLAGEQIGSVAITSDASGLMALVRDYSGLGETGEAVLVRRNGDAVEYITPLRFDPDAALRRQASMDTRDLAGACALREDNARYENLRDYRNRRVIAAVRHIPLTGWGVAVKIDRDEAFAPVHRLRSTLLEGFILTLAVVILVALLFARSITKPVIALTRAATRISGGELTERAAVSGTDELGTLGQAFNHMAQRLIESNTDLERRVRERTAALEQEVMVRRQAEAVAARKTAEMARDLDFAREFQESLLPRSYPTFPPESSANGLSLDFHHVYHATLTVGGDFFDVVKLSDHQAGVFIADVMGHGARSALVTAILRTLLEDLTTEARNPAEFLGLINRHFIDVLAKSDEFVFVTAFYMVLDTQNATARFASAGHPSPVVINRFSGAIDTLLGRRLNGPVLGLLHGSEYPESQRSIEAGDVFILYTDGIPEAMNAQGQEFGAARLRDCLAHAGGTPLPDICTQIMDVTRAFISPAPIDDDICIVGVEVTHRPKTPEAVP